MVDVWGARGRSLYSEQLNGSSWGAMGLSYLIFRMEGLIVCFGLTE